MKLSSAFFRRLMIGTNMAVLLGCASVASGEYRIDTLSKPVTLKAIPRSDNGKLVGMEVELGNSYLRYRSFKGQLALNYAGRFNASRLPAAKQKRYSHGMEGGAIYEVKNARQFLAENKERLFLGSDVTPTFVTIQNGQYVDGKPAVWVCVLSSESMKQYYETQIGHERCDAFRYSQATQYSKNLSDH